MVCLLFVVQCSFFVDSCLLSDVCCYVCCFVAGV